MTVITIPKRQPTKEQQERLRNLIGGTGIWNPKSTTVRSGHMNLHISKKMYPVIPGDKFNILGLTVKYDIQLEAQIKEGKFFIHWSSVFDSDWMIFQERYKGVGAVGHQRHDYGDSAFEFL